MEQRLQWRRRGMVTGVAVLLAAVLAYGFYPSPLALDMASVMRAPLRVTIEQEGRTRVVDRYVVAAPLAGYARRSPFDVGSAIDVGTTLVELEPLPPPALDLRSHAEAQARVSSAASRAESARQARDAARADEALARQELERLRQLRARGFSTAADLDRAASGAARATAMLRSAEFNAATAAYDLQAARTALIPPALQTPGQLLPVRSPIGGRVLKIPHKSEGPVAAGEPLVEIGDPSALEVEVDLLSADAVRVHPGTAVRFERWGGPTALLGVVKRVEPAGFTKVSALGVEEQRVWTIVALTSPRAQWQRLGDGYRVEASFVVADLPSVLQVPASALFRAGARWAVYVVDAGRARVRPVQPGISNGLETQVLAGLAAGERILSHPDDRVHDGLRVTRAN